MMAPTIYAEWLPLLDAFAARENDKEVLPAMQEGTMHLGRSVIDRFCFRLERAIRTRYRSITEDFQKAESSARDEADIEQAFLHLTDELSTLKKSVALPVLPESVRQKFPDFVQETANELEKSLEEQASRDPSGHLAHMLREHPVNRI
jgi:hypothetical protein